MTETLTLTPDPGLTQTFVQPFNRRKLLKTIGGGAVAVLVVGLESSCNASTILTDLQTIVNDADAVVIATANVAGTIPAPVFVMLETWLTSVKSAVDQALVIDAGAATLTAAQVVQITELFANLAVANIPGLGIEITGLIAVAEVAINTLLSLLHKTTPATVVAAAKAKTSYMGMGSMHHAVAAKSDSLGKRIVEMHKTRAKKLIASYKQVSFGPPMEPTGIIHGSEFPISGGDLGSHDYKSLA